ncbi:neprilysin-1-like [Oppia nitens]|uniref:neprilysin-1-like n=1 Tax=Oppia nitens TaxID=1686743 RepID=UPI0023DBC321|nr:neprilysin-1-like [Oppia nitens]
MSCWGKKSGLEKKLIIAIVIFVFISIGLLIGLIFAAIKKNNYENNDICETAECLKAASQIQSSLNLSVNPCDDFYEYACGGWMRTNIIPPDRSMWSQFDILNKNVHDKLRVLFESNIDSTYPPIIKQTVNLYKQCMDKDKRNSSIHELRDIVNQWPMIDKTVRLTDHWSQIYAKLNREHGFHFILFNSIDSDSKNTKINSIYVDSPTFGVGREQLVKSDDPNNKKILNAYKIFIKGSVLLLSKEMTNISDTIDNDIEDIVLFEQKLAKISAAPVDRIDRQALYGNKTNIKSFLRNYKNIPLLDIEKIVFKGYVMIDETTELIVYDRNYFSQLGDILNNEKQETIGNYLWWRTVQSLGGYTSQEFRDLEFQFTKHMTGQQESMQLWEVCVDNVSKKLMYSVGRLYADNYFPEKAKQDINLLIDALNEAFNESFDSNDWMEIMTKNKAKDKLKEMLRYIAYPDFIKDNNKLSDYYKELIIDVKKSYLQSIINYDFWSTKKMWIKLSENNKNRSEIEWSMSPTEINAYYSPDINRITFLAGILQSPFYTYELPFSLNIGAIGSVIGHEITHAFDYNGAQYDKFGNLYNWWDTTTKQRFNERVKCFIHQYSNYYSPEVQMHINGRTTNGENIADNGGIRQAFKALEKHTGPNQRLPATMKSFTPKQLFFLSFANIWCTNIRNEALINQIEYNEHSPNKYRVLGSVSNSREFAEAFNCKTGQQMNPKNKCILW